MSVTGELAQLKIIVPKLLSRTKDRRGRRPDRRLDSRRPKLEPVAIAGPDRRNDRDRRATNRISVSLDVEERMGDSFRTHDLSTFGVSTMGGPSYTIGTKLFLSIRLPDGDVRPVTVDAEVVGWHSETNGVRLAFRNPSVDTVRRIHRFVAKSA
ncbi:MAG: PilZ domain-containing protein [Myxococcaceae bacterium]